jgi:hypothetical protein
MLVIEFVVLLGVVITLLAWLFTRFLSPPRHDAADQPPIRPNVLFWLVGSITALVGVVMLIGGALAVADVQDPFHGAGPEQSADAASLFAWGAVVLVNGVYVWRGARRRGLRDRVGRLFIIVGYVVLGIALSRSIHSSVDLWATTSEEAARDVLNRTMLTFLGWGVPAAVLVKLGTVLAREKVLMTAEANAHY